MAYNLQALGLAVEELQEWRNELVSKSVQPSEGEATTNFSDDTLIPIQNVGEDVKFIKRSDFISSILGSVRSIDEVTAIGQIAVGVKSGINDGQFFIGYVNFYPPTQDSHINFVYQTY